jgi:hypothetical protein
MLDIWLLDMVFKEEKFRKNRCLSTQDGKELGLKLADRENNYKIRKTTKVFVSDVRTKMRKLKWQWAGHICRMENRWRKHLVEWYPYEGKRKRGHPRKQWKDVFTEITGVDWMRKARDRQLWKSLPHGRPTPHRLLLLPELNWFKQNKKYYLS